MPLFFVRNDIVKMKVDAVVNTANSSLLAGGGVCGAIFRAAGHSQLSNACRAIGHCPVGQAVITPAFDLQAKYVIHAVGPIWRGGNHQEANLLRGAYRSSLELAQQNKCESIAFPLISSGSYGYPKEQAFRIAVNTIKEYLNEQDDLQVYLIVFDKVAVQLAQRDFDTLSSYIDEHYIEAYTFDRCQAWEEHAHQTQLQEQEQEDEYRSMPSPKMGAPSPKMGAPSPKMGAPSPKMAKESYFEDILCLFKRKQLENALSHLDETFSTMLLRLIDERNLTDVQVYKRANIDRKLFSKLRKPSYTPSRQTALALAIALQLNLDDTKDLLGKAGYALSPSNKFDVIIQFFIENGIYDIYEINEALFLFDQKALG